MRFFFLLILLLPTLAFAQTATVVGSIKDETGETIIGAVIELEGTTISSLSDENGRYSIAVPSERKSSLIFTYVGSKAVRKNIDQLKSGEAIQIDIVMEPIDQNVIEIVDNISRSQADALVVKPADLVKFPSSTGSMEQVLQYIAPGVSAGPGGELTSQYSVRGGNYDENLVYVNGFEIYRPFLVRSGQQEGLTFPNPNLTRAFSFSTGGFSAYYGDKMSSALDVRYKRPTKFGASVEASLLGASAHVEGAVIKKKYRDKKFGNPERLTYLFGARYKTTQYLLNSTSLTGEYVPTFLDFQGNLVYDISKKWQVELLGNYNSSAFKLIPQDLSATTGLFNYALRLTAAFQGGERDDFITRMAGISATYQPRENLNFKWFLSNFHTTENERIDIISQYRLEEVETGLGSDDFGNVVGTLGYGETQQYVRNSLNADVTNVEWRGSWEHSKDRLYRKNDNFHTRRSTHYLQWGLKYQYEDIQDKLNEWERVDSLGYTLPYDTARLVFTNVVKTQINLQSNRFSAYIQDTWTLRNHASEFRINYGVRASFWDLNKEFFVAPRVQMYYAPRGVTLDTTDKLDNITFKLSVGAYYQPPFYRELRNQKGIINKDVVSQKSVHVVGGFAMDFRMMGNRKFKFITEAYYKHIWDMVPYDIDNVRIRYFGDNIASGYAAGLDLRLNGELVPDAESWINLSFLRVRERFDNVQHIIRAYNPTEFKVDTINVADVARPTDQAMILSMFFQDYLPKAKWLKVNMALTVGTGFPFGIPNNNVDARNLYRFNPYHRIDIGFSASLWNKALYEKRRELGKAKKDMGNVIKKFQSIWLSVEVFNLMAVSNAASNTWVKDFYNVSYAIPNYLTSRRVNVRFRVEF